MNFSSGGIRINEKKIDLSKDKEKISSEEKILHFYEKKIQKNGYQNFISKKKNK